MKTLIKLAKSCDKGIVGVAGHVLFEGSAARATDIETHAVIENGPWQFDSATIVPVERIAAALALSKKPAWVGDTLNGVKMSGTGSAADWPALPDTRPLVRIASVTIAADLARVLPAAARDDMRYYLVGVCFDHDAGKIIGCDGDRMHIVDDAYTANGLTGQAIVPIAALLLAGKNVLHFDFDAKFVRIGYAGGYLVAPLVDGRFPDYARMLPGSADRPNVQHFGAAQIAAVQGMVRVLKANKSEHFGLFVDNTGAMVAYDVTVPCFDRALVTDKYGDPLDYGVNARYLADALACAGEGTIACSDSNQDSLLVTADRFSAVVMPMRL